MQQRNVVVLDHETKECDGTARTSVIVPDRTRIELKFEQDDRSLHSQILPKRGISVADSRQSEGL